MKASSSRVALLLVAVAVVVVTTAAPAAGFVYKLPAQSAECFHELVEPGTTVSVSFTVTHGGKLDVNAAVTAVSLETGKSESVGEWTLASEGTKEWTAPPSVMPHRFEICFDNKMARWTPKWVSFDFFKMLPSHDDGITGEANKPFQKIELDLHTCANRIFAMRNSMTKLRAAEILHRDTMESVVNWIVWGSVAHCVLLVALGLFEFFYLKSFLAVRAVTRM